MLSKNENNISNSFPIIKVQISNTVPDSILQLAYWCSQGIELIYNQYSGYVSIPMHN